MTRTTEPNRIIFDSPASCWHEALPVGNGRLGAMVFGGRDHEILTINEDTLWCGEPETEKNATKPVLNRGNSASEQLAEISRLASERKYVEAHDLAYAAFEGSRDTSPYSCFGNLTIDIRNTDGEGDDGKGLFNRFLDMSRGICETEFELGSNRIIRKTYASAPADCIITSIKAERPIDVSLGFDSGCLTDVRRENDMLIAEGHCYAHDPLEGGSVIRYAGAAHVYCKGTVGNRRSPNGVTEAVVIFTAKTNYQAIRDALNSGADYEAAAYAGAKGLVDECIEVIRSASVEMIKSVGDTDRLLEDHLADFTKLYDRVKLEIPKEQSIYCTLFNYGRYLMITASREGTQPANLQGIWNNLLTPPWNCNYTVNINTEMNYWLIGPCNLHETAGPLLTMMEELCETGRQTAKDYYNAEGTCSFHNVNMWRKSSPAAGNPMWNFWPLGSQWLCRNLFEECLFTGDPEYTVRTEKVMRENLRFCLSIARQTKDGLAITPGTSPENEFWWRDDSPEIAKSGHHVSHPKAWDDWMALSEDGCRKIAVGEYSENENAIFRNLCRDYIDICSMLDELKVENENADYSYDTNLCERAREALTQIVPVQIDSRGRVMEWNEEMPEADEHHRHLSNLYELHPGRGITEADPRLYEAVRQSLLVRGDEGTGWSLAWKLLMWARMKDGEHEEGLLKMFTRHVEAVPMWGQGGGIYYNLFCAHPPFQIDGNYGFTAGVAEMLVQSHEDYIHILPALPPSWNRGSVTGLKARGNITVDITWNNGSVDVKFHGESGKKLRYRIFGGEIMEKTL